MRFMNNDFLHEGKAIIDTCGYPVVSFCRICSYKLLWLFGCWRQIIKSAASINTENIVMPPGIKIVQPPSTFSHLLASVALWSYRWWQHFWQVLFESLPLSLAVELQAHAVYCTMKPARRTARVNSHACNHRNRATNQLNHQQMCKTNKIYRHVDCHLQNNISFCYVPPVPSSATGLVQRERFSTR